MARRTSTGERQPARDGSAGFTLAALIGILAVLALLLGAILPVWAKRVQRAREAELISRGLQYAEAIRVFQRRFGRLPNQLSELVELEPRSIRRLWGNPLVGPEGGWLVILEGPGGQILTLDPDTGEVVGEPAGEGGNAPASGGPLVQGSGPRSSFGGQGAPGPGGGGVAGPIHGVRSRVGGDSYRKFFDQSDYGQWEFTVERLVDAASAPAPDGLPRRADYSTIGKPFRYPPPGGTAGGGRTANRQQQLEQMRQRLQENAQDPPAEDEQ